MKIPNEPQLGYPIRSWLRGLLCWLRSENIIAVRGGRLENSPNGKTIVVDFPESPKSQRQRLPFQIYGTKSTIPTIDATPGIFCGESYPTITESDPIVGTWYLQGLLVIDTGGGIVSTNVEWTQTEGTDSATDFYTTIAQINVIAGDPDPVPDPTSIIQYQYGTITPIIHGATDAVWAVEFI